MTARFPLALLACCLSLAAQAQQPAPKASSLRATEAMLLQELTAHRDWQAQADDQNTTIADLTKQLADTKEKLGKAEAQIATNAAAATPRTHGEGCPGVSPPVQPN